MSGELDIDEILQGRGSEGTLGEQSEQESDDNHPPDPWPLATLLFFWAIKNPQILDGDDLRDFLTPEVEPSTQHEIDRIAASFDRQVETGVRSAFERGDWDRVPEEVDNNLDISLGKPVSELSKEELASQPRRVLDLIFRRGDLDNQEYAEIMKLRLDEGEARAGFNTSSEEIQSYGGLKPFFEQKEKEGENQDG